MSNLILEVKSYGTEGGCTTIYVPYRMAMELSIPKGVNKIEITIFERLEA